MLIVLEGVDNSGKSTLARRLCDLAEVKYGWSTEIWHRGVPQRHPFDEYEADLDEFYPSRSSECDDLLIVADRWHLGQRVYGPIYRPNDPDLLTDAGLWHVDAKLRAVGAFQIILDAPTTTVMEREAAGKSELWQTTADAGYLKMEHVDQVRAAYRECARTFHLRVHDPLVWSDSDVQTLLDVAQSKHQTAKYTRRARTYVGPSSARGVDPIEILLFGEKRGFADPSELDEGSCFVPYPATSGRWLIDSLLTAPSYLHRKIGMANVLEEDAGALWMDLGYPQVVALGNAASTRLTQLQIPHGRVPHPQYGRRFHHSRREDYRDMILTAARDQQAHRFT